MKKKILLFLFSLTVCFGTYLICHFIAKKFFFDKFFYQKSIEYGYWVPNQKLAYKDFGKRAQDLDLLLTNKNNSEIINNEDNNTFRIAIFGDSLTWGQGVTNNQRFVTLLEKKLNTIRPTKIYSFANSGDNLFDHYAKYKLSQNEFGNMDLYIFALYNNDLVFNKNDNYQTDNFMKEISSDCKGSSIFVPPQGGDYNTLQKLSTEENSLNFCVYKKLLSFLPKEKTVYIDLGSIIENWDAQESFFNLISSDLPVIKTKYYEELCDKKNNPCQVSKKDGHPSAIIHKYYTNILFSEITTNPQYNFNIN